jgi:hypothetical protein
MSLRFTTNCQSEEVGFNLEAVKVDLGAEYITLDQTVFSSPEYPENYPSDLFKVWIVDFSEYGSTVLVSLQFLDFETTENEDFVEVST